MNLITPAEMKALTIQIVEPFAEFLEASPEECRFEVSLLDVARLSGHACPSVVGALLISRAAVDLLFPETKICERGDVRVQMPRGPQDGPSGPMAHVFSYIFGAWDETGFGGLRGGRFVRRNLLKFGQPGAPAGAYRFHRVSTGRSVDIYYDPQRVQVKEDLAFPLQWRHLTCQLIRHPEQVLQHEYVGYHEGVSTPR